MKIQGSLTNIREQTKPASTHPIYTIPRTNSNVAKPLPESAVAKQSIVHFRP